MAFEAYPGAVPLTHGSVSGPFHIVWHAEWTTDDPETVAAAYHASLGIAPDTSEGSFTFREPADAPKHVLAIHAPEASGPHRDGTAIPNEARAVLVFSTASRG